MKRYLFVIMIALGILLIAGCSTSYQDRVRLKEELKQEILAELRQQQTEPQLPQILTENKQEQFYTKTKEETEHDIPTNVQNQQHNQTQTVAQNFPEASNHSIKWRAVPVGKVEGRILRNSRGLPDCKVKLVRILKPKSVVEMFNSMQEGTEFTTITDEKGQYVFEKLTVGAYKLKWQLPNDTGWIRRIWDKPDAVVIEGQTTILKSVEASLRLINQ